MHENHYDAIVVHYGEVALKRGRRGYFERILARNLRKATGIEVKRLQGRIVLKPYSRKSLEKVGKVFGVVWYAPVMRAEDVEDLAEKLIKKLELLAPKSFKIETRRSDKSFPITSMEFSKILGSKISSRAGIRVDLENPETTIFVEITEDGIYASINRLSGPGGLPIGVSGKVLALISGGIDSPVAAWFMMRRGCRVDGLHIYNLPSVQDVMESKISEIVRKLTTYCFKMRLYLLPFEIFWRRSQEIPERFKLIVYRAYMFRMADIVADRYRYHGIVTGDNLGQVASQTLENMYAVAGFCKTPIYRPLIGFDKRETMDLARRIGTYEPSIQEYPEPCEVLGRYHPETRVRVEDVQKLWNRFELDEVVEETLKRLEIYEFRMEEEKPLKIKVKIK